MATQLATDSGYNGDVPDDSRPSMIRETSSLYRANLALESVKTCDCKPNHLNCMSAKDWLKSQIGVWQFNYEGRDIRDKTVHPVPFPSRSLGRLSNCSPIEASSFLMRG